MFWNIYSSTIYIVLNLLLSACPFSITLYFYSTTSYFCFYSATIYWKHKLQRNTLINHCYPYCTLGRCFCKILTNNNKKVVLQLKHLPALRVSCCECAYWFWKCVCKSICYIAGTASKSENYRFVLNSTSFFQLWKQLQLQCVIYLTRHRLQCEDNNRGQQQGGAADMGHSRTGEVRR